MEILFQAEQAKRISSELLTLSRTLRQTGYEIEDIHRELRRESAFESCLRECRQQRDNASALTACLVHLSTALYEVAEVYGRAEERNADRLEGTSGLYRSSAGGTLARGGGAVRAQITQFLYR